MTGTFAAGRRAAGKGARERSAEVAGGPERTTGEIVAALASLARALNQVKAHETFCRRAGVDLDRAGAALVYKLHSEGDGIRVCDLAERLGIDAPAVTRKVQRLERDGLVSRCADPSDGRASLVKLTAGGRRAIERLLQARERWIDDVIGDWPPSDRVVLARLLHRLADRIAAQEHVGD
jgi:DNA-binding MarR family transcriptional regulator